MSKELEKIIDRYHIWTVGDEFNSDTVISTDDARDAIRRAYELGYRSKVCKEDKDDYHIDPERQTKLEF